MMKQFEKWQRVLVLLITSLLVATVWAVDDSYTMNVNLTDGKTVSLTLTSQKPSVYCNNGQMTIYYYDQESQQYLNLSFERDLLKDLTFSTTSVLPVPIENSIMFAPDYTPVLIDDIDRVIFEVDIDDNNITGDNTDVLKVIMKDGSIYKKTCGKNTASVSFFKYTPFDNTYISTTTHQNNFNAEWNVNGVGKKDGYYSIGIYWYRNLFDFKNNRSGICFGTSPNLTVEQSEFVQYVNDSTEFHNKLEHYMFIGSKLSLPMYLQGCKYRFEDHIGEDNWLKTPLEYGKTYYYRTFSQGEMMQHGEMKPVTFYDVEKSFRVPKVMEDAGFKGFPIPTEEACKVFGSHFPDSVTAPLKEQIIDLWHEWQQTDEARQIDLSPYCTPIEFDNGTAYALNRIPDEFYTWLTHREVVIDAYGNIAELSKIATTGGDSIETIRPQMISDVDSSWNIPNNRYVRFEELVATVNHSVKYRSNEVIPGIPYKLQITFAPETGDGLKLPLKVDIDAFSMYGNEGMSLVKKMTASETEVTTFEVDNIDVTSMGFDLVIRTDVSSLERSRKMFTRAMRIAEIRLIPMHKDTVATPTFSWEGDRLAISTITEGADIYYSTKEYDMTPSGNGTLSSPYNVAGVLQYISTLGADNPSPDSVYIKGVVSSIRGVYPIYGNADFYITDNGSENGSSLFAYRIYNVGGQLMTSTDAVKVGDEVILHGKVTNYKGNTPETVGYSAYIYAFTTPEPNTLYQGPITVGNNVIVRAKAKKEGMYDSERAILRVGELRPIEVPKGLVTEDYTLRAWHYRYYGNEWTKYSKGQYKNNDEVLNIKIGFDGKDVYIQGFFNRYIPDAWVKGTMSDDESTITFQTQYYGTDYNGKNRFFFGYTIGNDNLSGDVVFQYDKETSTFVLPSTMGIADCINEDTFYGSDYYRWIVITKSYQEQESVVIPPEGLHLEDYSFSASVVTYDENNKIIETPSTFGIKVGFDGSDVYIKGLCQLLPESWIKGSIKDGKLTIAANQYMGYADKEVFITGIPINFTDWMQLEDIVFDYDFDTKVFSGGKEQFMLINGSKVRIYYKTEYINILISRLAEQSVKPNAPQLIEFGNYTDNMGYLRFNQPLTDIYGNALLEDKLYYQILVDDEHIINGYTFSPSRYETLESELSMIPYSFIENHYFDVIFNYDTRVADKIVYIKEEEPFTKNRIGLRTVYYGGGIENVSDTTWYFIREFADVLAMNEARQSLSEEIERANVLLNDSTKAKGKDVLLSAISSASQILTEITAPADIGIINQAIDSLKEAEEAYISLNQMIDPQEWVALQSFYQASNIGEGWTEKWDFSSNVPSVKTLPGVTAYDGHVTKIDIPNNKISGAFPVVLLSLPQLEYLNLSNNQLKGDIGVTMAAYIKMNPSAQIALKHVNIGNNQFTGNIGLFAACLSNLQSLDASGNCLEDVYPMISPNVTSLNIGQQTINRIVELDLSNLTVEAMAGKLPSILLYNHAKQTFIPEISILCTTGDLTDYLNNWSIILSYKNGKATVPYASDANVYYGQSGDVLNVGVVNDDGSLEGTTFRIKLNFENGDANFDGQVDVLDVQTDVMYIFETFKTRPFNFTAANQWPDEQINVQDIVTLVNLIFETKAPAAPSLRRSASTSEPEAIVFCRNGSLIVNTTRPVAAFDITLSGCSDINIKALSQQGFLCESRKTRDGVRLIGYSLSGNTLPVGETVVGLTNTNVATVYSVQLADTDALEIQSAVGDGNSTGISTISMPKRNSEEIYRIPLGDGHAISIDSQGKKTLINNSKTVK